MSRDIHNQVLLIEAGWRVFIIWECELSSKEKIEKTLNDLVIAIKNHRK